MLLLWLRAKTSAAVRAAVLGVSAGLFFGLSASFAKPVLDDLHVSIGEAAGDWRTWALLGFGFIAFLIQQLSLATGQLAPAMAAVSVSNPAVSVLLGIALYEERLTRPAWHVPVAVAALVGRVRGRGSDHARQPRDRAAGRSRLVRGRPVARRLIDDRGRSAGARQLDPPDEPRGRLRAARPTTRGAR